MSHEPIDTRATAYVFGELSDTAAAEFEIELAKSPQLRQEVAALRETIGSLKTDFSAEQNELSRAQQQVVAHAIRSRNAADDESMLVPTSKSFWQHRPLAIAALAASVLIVFGLSYPHLVAPSNDFGVVDGGSSGVLVVESNELTDLLTAFNDMMQQERWDEANGIAARVAELKPNDPISLALQQSCDLAKRLNEMEFAEDTDVVQKPVPTSDSPLIATIESTVDPEMESGQGESERTVPDELAQTDLANAGEQPPMVAADPSPNEAEVADDGNADAVATNARNRRAERETTEMDSMMMAMEADGDFGDDDPNDMAMMMGMEMMGGMELDFGMRPQFKDGMRFGDRFAPINGNSFVTVQHDPLSTFSIDVDTAAYAKVRAFLNQNTLPHPDAVRIEELVNYFDYSYPGPQAEDAHPFAASMQIATCPWETQHRLARVGIKGKTFKQQRPGSNLVFLLDVSGSMDEPNKLPLMIDGMKMLTNQLNDNDRVAIVVYAGGAGKVLDSTRGDKKRAILSALNRLQAQGSTNGAQGISLAYELARDNFIVGGTNRVILCTDGDFNVGVTDTDELVKLAEENAKSNVFLSVLGFGIGNHNDAMMELISNRGNGNYAFIDNKAEARKVLVEELGGTLVTIAKDVKVQVEFNPQEVSSYRLIGYENRVMAAEDFKDDRVDAGEIGAGHSITALYEIVPAKLNQPNENTKPLADDLRYQRPVKLSDEAHSGEMLLVKVRYKEPEGQASQSIDFVVKDRGLDISEADQDFKFAAAVAAFGMVLRDSPFKGTATLASITELAREGSRGDKSGRRREFVELVSQTRRLRGG